MIAAATREAIGEDAEVEELAPIEAKGKRDPVPAFRLVRLSGDRLRPPTTRRRTMAGSTLTWLGHSAFRMDTSGGKRIYVDPFLEGNPKCPESEKEPERVDLIAITHGHGDHVGSTVELHERFELPGPRAGRAQRLARLQEGRRRAREGNDPNKGGTWRWEGIEVSLTDANHSSSSNELEYLGEPVRPRRSSSRTASACTSPATRTSSATWRSIRRLYEPEVAVLPIGDHYTMGPKEAAVALELLGVKRCVPCHFGTFPVLRGTPQELQELAPNVEVHMIEPGDTIEL